MSLCRVLRGVRTEEVLRRGHLPRATEDLSEEINIMTVKMTAEKKEESQVSQSSTNLSSSCYSHQAER